MTYYQTPAFPGNMPGIWGGHWGYITNLTAQQMNGVSSAVVPGEWGGWYHDDDAVWMDALISYTGSIGMQSNFMWCMNPNSPSTGGLLDNDWKTPNYTKLLKCSQFQPNPTKVEYNAANNQVCYT